MPVSFSSAARNLFLLGSTGTVANNFFQQVDESSNPLGAWIPKDIIYNYSDQKYIIGGYNSNSNTKDLGWISKRDYDIETDPENPTTTEEWNVTASSTDPAGEIRFNAIKLDYNGEIAAVGYVADASGPVPFVAKYRSSGLQKWQATSYYGNGIIKDVDCDDSGCVYVCGENQQGESFVEKYDDIGQPVWRKVVYTGDGNDNTVLNSIGVNDRGEVVAGGTLDTGRTQGYLIKIDTNTGQVMWDKSFERHYDIQGGNNFGYEAPVGIDELYIDSKDQIYVAGFYGSPTRQWVAKLTGEGNLIWQRGTTNTTNVFGGLSVRPIGIRSDGETEQTIVLSWQGDQTQVYLLLSKYSKNGDLVWRRKLDKGDEFSATPLKVYGGSLDADPSFYYLTYVDQNYNPVGGTPDRYYFGKVSSSGNGLGDFDYDDGSAVTLEYTISNLTDTTERLRDGAVRNDTSDLISYPFTASKLVFDDLATPVANKKRQAPEKDLVEFSGSPAIRISDFQEMNLGTQTKEVASASGPAQGQQLFVRSQADYTSMLSSGQLKTESNAFTFPITNSGSNFRSEGVGGLLLTFTNPIPYSSQVRILDNNNVTATWLNQTSATGSSVQHINGWKTVASGSGTLNTIFFQRTDDPSYDAGFCGILVDGYLLFDGGYDLGERDQVFTAPAGVTSVSVVCVGGGGAGGGALAYKNNITVVPGANYNIQVGAPGYNIGGAGSNNGTSGTLSQFVSSGATVVAEGGVTGSTTRATQQGQYDGGGDGGYSYNGGGYSGGGAGGYSGNGGDAEIGYTVGPDANSGAGAGGDWAYNGGGGVGVLGKGTTGSSGSGGGGGGSGGTAGIAQGTENAASVTGGTYGGGFTGRWEGNQGGPGAVRVIWGANRQFPDTNTADVSSSAGGSNTTFVLDESGKGNDVEVDGATLNAAGYWEFDGTNDKLVGPPCNTILSADSSIELWVNFDDVTTRQTIISGYDSTPNTNPNRWDFEITDDRFRGGFHGNGYFNSSTTINTGEWHHVMFVLDSVSNTLKFYLDGVEDLSQSCNGFDFGGPDVELGIGDRNDSSIGPMDGKIGEVRIYRRALTAAQVFQNYNSTKSKYIAEASDTAPRVTNDPILVDSSSLLNYDFGNKACYDPATNILFGSEDWNHPGWLGYCGAGTKGYNGVDVNTTEVLTPVGDNTAIGFYRTTSNCAAGNAYGIHWFVSNSGGSALVQSGQTYTVSAYLRGKVGGETVQLGFDDGATTNHQLTTEWVRYTHTGTPSTGTTRGFQAVVNDQNAGFYLWHPQVERGSNVGRYVPTYGTSINLSYGINSLVPTETGGTFNDEPKNQFIDGTVRCNGSFEFITFSNPSITVSDGSSSTVSWTAELWIKPDAYTGSSDIADLLSDGTYKIELEQGGSDAGKIRYNYSSTVSNFSTQTLTAGQWNHVVVKFSPFPAATSVSIQAWINNTFAMNTGHSEPLQQIVNRSGVGFKGRIAELRIYGKDLTDAEREGNWNATRAKYGL